MVPMSYNVGKQSGALFIAAGGITDWVNELGGLSSRRPSVRTRPSPRAVRLFFATLVAMALFSLGSTASAAVPMCSEDGRTIAAPPIMRANPGRMLESRGDCERLRELLTNSNPGNHHGGSPLEAADAPLRAVPPRASVPAAPCLARLDVTTDDARARPGAVLDVFRPPRR